MGYDGRRETAEHADVRRSRGSVRAVANLARLQLIGHSVIASFDRTWLRRCKSFNREAAVSRTLCAKPGRCCCEVERVLRSERGFNYPQ